MGFSLTNSFIIPLLKKSADYSIESDKENEFGIHRQENKLSKSTHSGLLDAILKSKDQLKKLLSELNFPSLYSWLFLLVILSTISIFTVSIVDNILLKSLFDHSVANMRTSLDQFDMGSSAHEASTWMLQVIAYNMNKTTLRYTYPYYGNYDDIYSRNYSSSYNYTSQYNFTSYRNSTSNRTYQGKTEDQLFNWTRGRIQQCISTASQSMLQIQTDRYAGKAKSTFSHSINYTYIDAGFTCPIDNFYVDMSMLLGIASMISRFTKIADYSLTNLRVIEYEINLKNYILSANFDLQQSLLDELTKDTDDIFKTFCLISYLMVSAMLVIILAQAILIFCIKKGNSEHCSLFLKIPIKECLFQEINAKTFLDQMKVKLLK